MKRQDSIGHLENEIHFQRGAGVARRLKPVLICQGSTVRLEAAPFQNGC
jgi:hypothetical protein